MQLLKNKNKKPVFRTFKLNRFKVKPLYKGALLENTLMEKSVLEALFI